ncbi:MULTISPECIES: metallopeptidase TldD-related protein [Rhodococcus]|uniref:metallopeptidase TldD-related protein n=1 Tax=Rhodococcus TaxID=1827 RepID=UPI000BE35CB6|nr:MULTISPECIES: metallopeptidase TldD-related protein [Rhodococcus]MBP1158796.1 putative Zn-dependent protease [Rhodococcus sp. PvR099]MCZ4558951.1 metallopeptidase TldD-related protein [Rhodococcus maanshanensis]
MIQAQDVIERALALRTVDESMVLVTDASEASLRWAGNSMTTNGVSTSRNWTVISIVRDAEGAHVGTVSSSTVDPKQIPEVVRASEEAARTAPPAEDAMDLMSGAGVPDPDWSAAAASTGIDVFGRLAGDLADGFDGADRLYGFAHHQLHTTWLGTSSGVRRRFTQPTGSVEINGKRGDASAWVGAGTADFEDVSVPSLLAELTTRLNWSKRTVDLPAGRYETLLPPSAVSDLMIYLMWTMEGRGAEEGHTALSKAGGTRVGERLSDFPLTLRSDPMAPGLEYAPFVATTTSSDSLSLFDNGMDVDRVDWVRDGAVNALAYPRHAAQEFGATVAVPGDNLLLTGGGAATIDEMVARTERGLLLTTLWYIREVDPATLLLTGLTRDGVYLVEDGAVTGAVNNFRFNESPLDLLRRVSEVGATESTLPREWKDWFTRTAMPPLRIPDFHMSSVSRAQ